MVNFSLIYEEYSHVVLSDNQLKCFFENNNETDHKHEHSKKRFFIGKRKFNRRLHSAHAKENELYIPKVKIRLT